VGRRSNRKLGWIVFAAVALLADVAAAATLNKRARLREGPGRESRLLGWVEEGTAVTLEGERSGWYAVRTPDGQTGFVWQEHLRFESGEGAPVALAVTTTVPAPTIAPPPSPAPTPPPLPETRPSPTERSDGNVAGELERMRSEVSRLATAQQDLAQRLGRGGAAGGAPPPLGSDGTAGAAVVFFGAGAIVGWLFGRFGPGRRDRRTRLRL